MTQLALARDVVIGQVSEDTFNILLILTEVGTLGFKRTLASNSGRTALNQSDDNFFANGP